MTRYERTGERDNRVTYRVRNEGPEDLDSVVIHRPHSEDRTVYPVGALGGDVADAVELGPLPMRPERRFVLAVGSAPTLPTFRVRIACSAGHDPAVVAASRSDLVRGARHGRVSGPPVRPWADSRNNAWAR